MTRNRLILDASLDSDGVVRGKLKVENMTTMDMAAIYAVFTTWVNKQVNTHSFDDPISLQETLEWTEK